MIGHYRYYGVNGNFKWILGFYKYVKYEYYRILIRRGQRHPIPYDRYLYYWNKVGVTHPKLYVNIW